MEFILSDPIRPSQVPISLSFIALFHIRNSKFPTAPNAMCDEWSRFPATQNDKSPAKLRISDPKAVGISKFLASV
jgi:hypothetical protein